MNLLKEQCVSVSELRKNPMHYFKMSAKMPIYIFSNNNLVGKLIDPESDSDYFSIEFKKPKSAKDLLQELENND